MAKATGHKVWQDKTINRRKFLRYGLGATGAVAASSYVKPSLTSIGIPDVFANLSPLGSSSVSNFTCIDCIDFETDGSGTPLNAGDIIAEQWAAFGIHLVALNKGRIPKSKIPDAGIPFHKRPLMIFDSSNPTNADLDLGTPNGLIQVGRKQRQGQVAGGPGVGSSRYAGTGNDSAQGNVLIISKGSSSAPNDEERGGVITFTFDKPVGIESVDVLDIDDDNGPGSRIRTFEEARFRNGNMTFDYKMPNLGDNSFQTVFVNQENVRRMEVFLKRGGAISKVCFKTPICV